MFELVKSIWTALFTDPRQRETSQDSRSQLSPERERACRPDDLAV